MDEADKLLPQVINAYWHQRFQQRVWKRHGGLNNYVINAYWHQRFQQPESCYVRFLGQNVINAYWHQRFQQNSQSKRIGARGNVINAYWHQRFQQDWKGWLKTTLDWRDQRLLASKVSTVTRFCCLIIGWIS